MRTYVEIVESMVNGRTFSNHSEYEIWASRWCYRCRWDCVTNPGEEEPGCNISAAAFLNSGKRPAEWTTRVEEWSVGGSSGSYDVIDTCTQFEERTEDDDAPEPPPAPPPPGEVPGQLDIIDAYLPDALAELTRPVLTESTVS